jgi:hypothetical protein
LKVVLKRKCEIGKVIPSKTTGNRIEAERGERKREKKKV